MSEVKKYIAELLKKSNIEVVNRHARIFDDFIKDPSIIEAYKTIQTSQTDMLNNWKERSKIEDIKHEQVMLPNGTAGKAYEYILDLKKGVLADIGEFNLVIPEKTGLVFNRETNKISGILNEKGEYALILKFKLVGDAADRPFIDKEIKLFINADPKSLWKDIPSDKHADYWKADNVSASSQFGDKKLIVGSKRGRSHAHEGKFRDDAFDFYYNDDTGWGVIAVADGAGSAKYSRKGSELACDFVIDYFRQLSPEKYEEMEAKASAFIKNGSEENGRDMSSLYVPLIGNAALGAQKTIRDEMTKKSAEMRDYSTTLLFAILKKIENKYFIASFWVGDGGIGIYKKDSNELIIPGTPDSGEFAGQTRFLTMSDTFEGNSYIQRIKISTIDDFTALVLMTDGITDPKFQTDANLGRIEKWNELWEDLGGKNNDDCKVDFSKPLDDVETKLMSWLDFWSAGNHDDRTIAILY